MSPDPATTEVSELQPALEDFAKRFNDNSRARKLVKKWNRNIVVEATDTGTTYTMVVADQELRAIHPGWHSEEDDPFLVHMQAPQSSLVEIFWGRYNPSTALLDGILAVFSNDRDKVKLEALAMVIWGL